MGIFNVDNMRTMFRLFPFCRKEKEQNEKDNAIDIVSLPSKDASILLVNFLFCFFRKIILTFMGVEYHGQLVVEIEIEKHV